MLQTQKLITNNTTSRALDVGTDLAQAKQSTNKRKVEHLKGACRGKLKACITKLDIHETLLSPPTKNSVFRDKKQRALNRCAYSHLPITRNGKFYKNKYNVI